MTLMDSEIRSHALLAATNHTGLRMPDEPARICDYLTDGDLREGIREVFGEADGFREDLVERLLQNYKTSEEVEDRLMKNLYSTIASYFRER